MGLMIGLLAFIPNFAQAQDNPPDETPVLYASSDLAQPAYVLAQNDTTPTKPSGWQTVDNVVDAAGQVVPIDTVENLGDILEKGLYYIQNPPPKGSPVSLWISYILGIIGLVFGAFEYIRANSLKKQLQVAERNSKGRSS
jgi:hypothetical protein